jgi:hypothetical protein
VFLDSPDDIERDENAVTIQQFWEGDGLAKLPGPEWAPIVDASRWTANITAMKGELQNVRRKASKKAEKDEEWQLARRVVKAAVRHIPSLVDVGVEVVGFEEQEAALAAELGGRLGVWLYGQGAALRGVYIGLTGGSAMQCILCCASKNKSAHKCHSIPCSPRCRLRCWWSGGWASSGCPRYGMGVTRGVLLQRAKGGHCQHRGALLPRYRRLTNAWYYGCPGLQGDAVYCCAPPTAQSLTMHCMPMQAGAARAPWPRSCSTGWQAASPTAPLWRFNNATAPTRQRSTWRQL